MVLLLRCSLVFFLYLSFSFSTVINVQNLKKEPKSLVKDYYFYRLLTEGNYTKDDVYTLRDDVYRYKGRLKTAIEKVIGSKPEVVSQCEMTYPNIMDANESCQIKLLYMSRVLNLSNEDRNKLIEKYQSSYPNSANMLMGLNSKHPALYYEKTLDSSNFITYYNIYNKNKNFDKRYNLDFINKLINEKRFENTIKSFVINKNMSKFRKSLLKADPKNSYSYNVAFYLGVNALLFDKPDIAIKFFKQAANMASYQSFKDNANFWVYYLSKDKTTLLDIANSDDINIYSIYARELTRVDKKDIFVPRPKVASLKYYSVSDPFTWEYTKKTIKDMNSSQLTDFAAKFYTIDTVGHYSYMMEKASNYKNHYYPMAYDYLLDGVDVHRKALIFALARQESRFIPSAISVSYALGMMQFMPFLANDIGKKQLNIENFDQDDMFKPEVAYKFANVHLDYLEKYLYHPIFIAYAYNGGIGFTKKMLVNDAMFLKGKYEPFLSMELVKADETRDYGKKVLSNYVVYLNALAANTSIQKLFEMLVQSEPMDKFRN
ncbi:lytic transglycosylase domain-containing protein [Campylobacter sputorum]|uniref:lytic transglycosylase domain-containing protein n=1 Tax=Campylobacter sputorum TaxID=206 RepID=UPI00068A4987|nr:lytic transglycosylase domain-containing protein [Campylobacter sputorum]